MKPQEETSEVFFFSPLENAALEVSPCSLVGEDSKNQLIDLERCFHGTPAVSAVVPAVGRGEQGRRECVVAGCAVSAPAPARAPCLTILKSGQKSISCI